MIQLQTNKKHMPENEKGIIHQLEDISEKDDTIVIYAKNFNGRIVGIIPKDSAYGTVKITETSNTFVLEFTDSK